ncbi:UNKNOWN [Stylonychia lemnae]|uniref:Uncharacterized protein n=1 Tax=Stylonychia lemnae TaxID=5949 RepID=A0A078AU04_STYLE|nr:UNKNOWN [Stylonychia lemnae]|eukprot:CDW85456.1 UNKNOWN [Stylonychia lemnae]
MKALKLASLMTLATVASAATNYDTITLLKTFAPLVTSDKVLQEQFILGMQADPTQTTSECYASYLLWRQSADKISTAKASIEAKTENNNNNILNLCDYQNIIVQIGSFTQKLSGLSSQLVNCGFRALSDDYKDFNAACNNYEGINKSLGTDMTDSSGATYKVYCGTELAKVFKKFINTQTPVYSNNEYKKVQTQNAESIQ